MNGTPNLDWMLSNISITKDFNEINSLIKNVSIGCGGVIYHPYIYQCQEKEHHFITDMLE